MNNEKITMDVLTAIKKRRSIRAFSEEEVLETDLDTLLYAAQMAPSAHNTQPWHFLIIRDKVKLEKMAEASTYAKMLTQSPVAIMVLGDLEKQATEEFLFADLSASIENILLTATALELGSCWCGIVKDSPFYKAIIDMYKMPLHIRPFAIIALGHPRQDRGIKDVFDESKVTYDIWK